MAPLYLSDISHIKNVAKHPPLDTALGTGSIGETTTISSPGTEAVREENLPILSETHSEQKTEEKPNEEPSLTSFGITGLYELGQQGITTDDVQDQEEEEIVEYEYHYLIPDKPDEVQDYHSSQKSEVRHQNNSENY